jgi:iron complex outermembrane receptor protein
MNVNILNKLLLGTSLLAATAYAAPTYAQTSTDDQMVEDTDVELLEDLVEEEEASNGDEMIVTGSRIKRDTFSSISPLQVITTDLSQDVGLFDPATLLQTSEAAGGQQIDGTFQGFVLDNGPGSQTLNLRGLGADRTLLLVNGRRVAPAGVEGSPSNPSINLIPGSLVERYDLLLDGASSVYGSDAVAGVGNLVLKRDFEGFEVFARGSVNEQGGDTDYTISGTYGKNFDRGFIGVGAEYDYRDDVRFGDRDFLTGCDTHYEIDEDGEIRRLGISDRLNVEDRTPGVSVSNNECKIGGISGRIFLPFTRAGSVYFTEGPGNSGIDGYNESTAFPPGFTGIAPFDVDANGDGIRDVDFQDVNTNGLFPETTFIPEQHRYSVMTFGEYTLEGDANLTPYFEVLYNRVDISSDTAGSPQVFPTVPGANAFNPCNLANNDCGAADAVLLGVPVNAGFNLPTVPIFAVEGDRDNFDVTQEQYRLVGGVRGDIPGLNIGENFNDWSFDVYGMYSRSDGSSVRRGVREDKLAFALGIDPTQDFDGDGIFDNDGDGLADDYNNGVRFPDTLTPCDASALQNPGFLLPDVTEGCVAANLFAPSLLGSPIGTFATQAETDYLFGERTFDTVYEQTVISGFATGNIFKLPAGPVSAVIGAEYREDEIDSRPDAIASQGLFFGFFSDQGAQGKKSITEAFGELNVPLVADKPIFRELEVNFSGRLVDEEFYGFASTYSVKGGWRPINSLLLKGSYGTSFRAPNLRENFLGGSTGFNGVFDPCAVPQEVIAGEADPRDQRILENCRREGRDPLRVGIDPTLGTTFANPSVEISTGGSFELEEETSTALTLGAAWEQPFFDSFDLNLNVNYYDIKIDGSIVSPNAQFIVNDCYTRQETTRSTFCDRIGTDANPDSRLLISDIDASFINQDRERATGLDFNAAFGKEFNAFDKAMDFGFNLRANRVLEISDTFIGDDGLVNFDDDVGEFSNPRWTGRGTATLDVDDFRFTWQARYIGKVAQEPIGVDEFSDALDTRGTGFVGNTCDGNSGTEFAGFCRDVGFASDVWTHTASMRYRSDSMTLRLGVANIFDRNPPSIDTDEVFGISNTPIGAGYDLDGREFFASISKAF